MSEKYHKRKRSNKDTPVDLTKMQLVRQGLAALQEELAGIKETEEEMEEVMKHVDALQYILGTAKRLKLPFSSLRYPDLDKMGVKRNKLRFNSPPPDAETLNSVIDEEHLDSLCTQIGRIHRYVSMKYEQGTRMILDAILLAVAQICVEGGVQLPVAILPKLRVAPSDGILIRNAATNFQVWLTGNTDYGMCVYEDEDDRSRLLGGSITEVVLYAKSRIMMVEAKRCAYELDFEDYLPEATGQAVALGEVTGKPVRFCLSNGHNWLFSLFAKDANGNRVAYEGSTVNIMTPRPGAEDLFKGDVRRVVELLYHWLVSTSDPLNDPLYTLSVWQ
ncbi:hypothetical protein C8Q74DRAFT_1214075 [Fomes fomentarius]|nr:hypothetical protein C8Q74DRAFT_1214075 [Fomes fomentarius]